MATCDPHTGNRRHTLRDVGIDHSDTLAETWPTLTFIECAHCGLMFVMGSQPTVKYCSRSCLKQAGYQRARERRKNG